MNLYSHYIRVKAIIGEGILIKLKLNLSISNYCNSHWCGHIAKHSTLTTLPSHLYGEAADGSIVTTTIVSVYWLN